LSIAADGHEPHVSRHRSSPASPDSCRRSCYTLADDSGRDRWQLCVRSSGQRGRM